MVRPFQQPLRRIFILVVSLGGILASGLVFGFAQRRRDVNSQSRHSMGIIISNAPFIIENNYIAERSITNFAAGDSVQIYHNTCLQQGDIVAESVPGTRNSVFREYVTNLGTYGMNCVTPGGFSKCWPG